MPEQRAGALHTAALQEPLRGKSRHFPEQLPQVHRAHPTDLGEDRRRQGYLVKMGMEIRDIKINPEFPEIGNGEAILWGTPQCGGVFDRVFGDHVVERGIKILFETPARELIQNPVTKEIIGVVAENEGRRMFIKARRAVVLCTGGFKRTKR